MNWKMTRLFFSLFIILHLEILASAQDDRLYKDPSVPTEQRIEDLLSRMLLEEKIGQMNQLHFKKTDSSLKDKVRQGNVGSLLNIVDPEEVNQLQKIALTQSRLGIPLIIGRDIIHGFKTIFPVPLGQAASFDDDLVKLGAHIAAKEAREKGINWTFAPMLDISRDARWGRIAESFGEDPHLAGVLGVAMVKGFQGDNLSAGSSIAACLKHFAGYGAAEGGRDYNSTNIPVHLLRNIYLAPFQKAINAGAATVMTSFNENDGIPSSGNDFLLKQVLRKEWKFDGFVISDWASIPEMITHGYANDRKHAVELAANAGLDMEMATQSYIEHLPQLLRENKISIAAIDSMVKNILRIKFRMGLFEDPYVKPEEPSTIYSENHLQAARDAAVKSAILLKNENKLLPLSVTKKIAVIGPLADAPHDQLGTWVFDGDKAHTITPLKALQTEYNSIQYIYEPALNYSRDKDTSRFTKAVEAVRKSDVAVVFLGEESILSGEAHSLSNINLIGVQSDLLVALKRAGKPVVLVIMAGRPLTIARDLPNVDAVLYNFHPGTMGGPAIFDLLFGKANPSGKLPVTFVNEVGQIPLYYNHNNTGRPSLKDETPIDDILREARQSSLGNTSYYLDSGKDPLYPFGFGLSYTEFQYSDLKLSASFIPVAGKLIISATVKNTGNYEGAEVVQLYVQDKVASVVRPVKELKGFKKVTLKPGQQQVIEFELTCEDVAFYGRDMVKKCEEGIFKVWVGGDSRTGMSAEFRIE